MWQSVLESLAIRKDVRLLPAVDFHCEHHAFRKFSAQELKSFLRVKSVFSPLLVMGSHSDSRSEKLVRAGKPDEDNSNSSRAAAESLTLSELRSSLEWKSSLPLVAQFL